MTGVFVLHLHYPDLALDLVRRVGRIDNGFSVIATGAALDDPAVARALDGLDRPVERVVVENRGRDIGAFLAVLPRVLANGAELVVKLHTKGGGSGYGREWRERLWDRLATPDAAREIETAFAEDAMLGLVAAESLLKPVASHLFRNGPALDVLVARLWSQASPPAWKRSAFPAGSMFWARRAILEPLAALAPELEFEPEGAVHDGRLEHAIERVVGLAAAQAGLAEAILSRASEARVVYPHGPDLDPLIDTLSRMRQARLDTLSSGPDDPRAIALASARNPLLHYLNGGGFDPNRLTHEGWRRDRRPDPNPSLVDWPAGPPASPLLDGRGAPDLSARLAQRHAVPAPRDVRRRRVATNSAALNIRIVTAPGDEARAAQLLGALQRLGHNADLNLAFDEAADICLVLGGDSRLRPPPGPLTVLLPLERTPRVAYAEIDRYDLALVDRAWAGLLHLSVKARVAPLPAVAGTDAAAVESWSRALLAEIRAGVDAPATPRRTAGAQPGVRLIVRAGAGGWPRSSAYIRLIAPMTAPDRRDQPGLILDDGALAVGAGETVVVQRDGLADLAAADLLIRRVRDAGARLLLDLDDALMLIDRDHPDYDVFAPRLDALARIADAAEAITVATPELAALADDPIRTRIVPNRLDRRLWREALARPIASPRVSGPVHLLYMGTATHDSDLAPVFAALERLERERPGRIVLTLIGGQRDTPDQPWLRRLSPAPAQRAYPRFTRWLGRQTAADGGPFDAGLAPLVDTPFNACKSDLKLLDYAALGLPALVSATTTYSGHAAAGRALSVEPSEAAWTTVLAGLVARREELGAIAVAARHYLLATRLDFNEQAALSLASAVST